VKNGITETNDSESKSSPLLPQRLARKGKEESLLKSLN